VTRKNGLRAPMWRHRSSELKELSPAVDPSVSAHRLDAAILPLRLVLEEAVEIPSPGCCSREWMIGLQRRPRETSERAKMFRRKDPALQPSFWIPTSKLPSTPVNAFYRRLNRALSNSGFGDAVRALCVPFYESYTSRGGRRGIDPEVYFKMLIIGVFENLPSERAIAARCSD
jgi:hypothetical protein